MTGRRSPPGRARLTAPGIRLALLLSCLALAAPGARGADGAANEDPAATPAQPEPARSARVEAAYREYRERRDAGQLADALGPAKRAYDYAQQDLGVEDDGLARTAAALGSLLLDLDRPLDALRPLTHARELYDLQRGPSSTRARIMQRKVAEANQQLGRYETAERTYLDLIARARARSGDPTAELAGVYARLQVLTEEAGAQPRSRRYGLEAMKHYRKARGPESLPEGLVAIRIGRGALQAGDWSEGLDLIEYGTPIVEKRLERGDPQLTTLYELLIGIYEQTGDTPKLRRYRIRLKKNREREEAFARRRQDDAAPPAEDEVEREEGDASVDER